MTEHLYCWQGGTYRGQDSARNLRIFFGVFFVHQLKLCQITLHTCPNQRWLESDMLPAESYICRKGLFHLDPCSRHSLAEDRTFLQRICAKIVRQWRILFPGTPSNNLQRPSRWEDFPRSIDESKVRQDVSDGGRFVASSAIMRRNVHGKVKVVSPCGA
jgi:hypothetical protein